MLDNRRTRRPYRPSRPGDLPWYGLSLLFWLMFRPSVVRRDTRRRDRKAMVHDAIESSIGTCPVAEDREMVLRLVMDTLIIAAFAFGLTGLAVGSVTRYSFGALPGTVVMRSFGVLVSAPCLALGFVWAARAQFNDIDVKRWRKAGEPQPYVPSNLSQPKNRDALYAAPIWILVALFFISA